MEHYSYRIVEIVDILRAAEYIQQWNGYYVKDKAVKEKSHEFGLLKNLQMSLYH